jgi:hypothetical protein
MSTEFYLSLQIPAPLREFMAGMGIWTMAVLTLVMTAS